eukprot:324599_1
MHRVLQHIKNGKWKEAHTEVAKEAAQNGVQAGVNMLQDVWKTAYVMVELYGNCQENGQPLHVKTVPEFEQLIDDNDIDIDQWYIFFNGRNDKFEAKAEYFANNYIRNIVFQFSELFKKKKN